jgi:phthiocerol/phenolphthiocerol synthesis type-I polyketide synthase C
MFANSQKRISMPVTRRSRPIGLVDAIRQEAADRPDDVWCRFLPDGITLGGSVTRRELDTRCRQIALMLEEFVRPGDRVLIMCEPGLDYVAAFVGCLYAGAIAVPAYPPSPLVLERSLARLNAVVRDADPAYALTSHALAPVLAAAPPLRRRDGSRVLHLSIDDATGPADGWHDGAFGTGDDIAFLQYTSGSTGDPKGVIVRDENLLANLAMITDTFGDPHGTTNVTWLPPYHDMGLVGLILWPLACGGDVVMLPPDAFLRRPETWLAAISTYQARLTASPNFGYELAARRTSAERAAALDLSGFSVAINGAEPVSATSMQAFVDRFGDAGFRADAFHPAYGLAEATLLVASAPWGSGSASRHFDAAALADGRLAVADRRSDSLSVSRIVTSCGPVAARSAVRIVAPGTDVDVSEGQVGELVISGAHVTSGYWRRGDAAQVDGTLRTGDLGAFYNGELVITGRIKDLIVIRGKNHYPQDIEQTVETAHPAIRKGCVAAFAVDEDGKETVVVVAEIDETQEPGEIHPAIGAAISHVVNSSHGIRPSDVVLVAARTIPKTSSGKLQRSATRDAYRAGTLATVTADEQRLRLPA